MLRQLSPSTLRSRRRGPKVLALSVLRWSLTLIALLASSAAGAVASEAEAAQTTSQAKAGPSAASAQLSLQHHVVSWRVAERWVDALIKLQLGFSPPAAEQVLEIAAATSGSPEPVEVSPSAISSLLSDSLQPRAPPRH